MNDGMPPRSRNHRLPAACDALTATAASSLVNPFAISRQNNRSTSRRSDGAPGDFMGALPVNSFIHPAGLPIHTSTIEVLRRPVESALAAAVGVEQHAGRWPPGGAGVAQRLATRSVRRWSAVAHPTTR